MAEDLLKPPKVFISYTHDSNEHADRVLHLANRLRRDGIDADVAAISARVTEAPGQYLAPPVVLLKSFNTANGAGALASNTTGDGNSANGFEALFHNTTGGNTANGVNALFRIGHSFIGAAYIAGISGQTASGGAAVFVNSQGKLGTSTSSARFKDEIKLMGKASEALFALKPVTFRYKKEIDPQGIP